MSDISTTDSRDQERGVMRQRIAELEAAAATHAFERAVGTSLRAYIPDNGVFVFNADLRFVMVDAPALTRIGVDGTTMIGHTIWEVMPPENAALLEGPYRAALQGETTIFTDAFAGGVYRFTTVPVHDDAGKIIAGMAVLADITAQVTAEQRLHMFAQLVEHAPDGIFARDAAGTILYANPAMEAMLGTAPLTSVPFSTVLAPQSLHVAAIGERLRAGQAWSGRLIYQRADGTTFPGQATVFSFAARGGQPI